jgi:hypothetical protein
MQAKLLLFVLERELVWTQKFSCPCLFRTLSSNQTQETHHSTIPSEQNETEEVYHYVLKLCQNHPPVDEHVCLPPNYLETIFAREESLARTRFMKAGFQL